MIVSNASFNLGEYEGAVRSTLDRMQRENIIARIWQHDHTVWKPEPTEIVNRLGWLTAPADTLKKIHEIRSVIIPIINSGITDVVLLGMGGSSLAAEVFKDIFGSAVGCPTLRILDTTDPAVIASVTSSLNLNKSLFIVSSKSGSTLEVNSLFQYFYNLVLKESGSRARGLFLFITDVGSPMAKLADKVSDTPAFLNNPDIGGRYSALSLPGIVPAALCGIDIERLLRQAIAAADTEKKQILSGDLIYTGAVLGAVLGTLAQIGRNKLTLIMPPDWISFGNWIEQLIAESTGKEGKGIVPVIGETLTDKSGFGRDRLFVVFQHAGKSDPSVNKMIDAGHPLITINIGDSYDLGAQMFIWEMATAVAAHVMGVNPFDQPDVEKTKIHTRRMIEQSHNKELPKLAASLSTPQCDIYGDVNGHKVSEILNNFLKQARPSDYVCLQVYLSPTPLLNNALRQLREQIVNRYGLAVVCGYGPRYLHSTGQLHKGDSGNGLFIQLTADDLIDVDIPDKISAPDSTLTFGRLKAAQAQGDWQALQDAGRRIIRFHFKTDPAAGLNILTDLI